MSGFRDFDPSVLSPPLDEEGIARQYEVVRERTLRGRGAPRRLARVTRLSAAVAVAAAVALLLVWRPFRTSKLTDSAILVAGPSGEPVRVALPEGSSVQLGANTRAKLTRVQPKAIRIDVETGSVEIEATHVGDRTFVVGAGPYDVRVTGTHFRVDRIPGERVSVRVEEGVVEVSSAGDAARRLRAGEEWSAPDGPVAHQASPGETPASEPVPEPSPAASSPDAAAARPRASIALPRAAAGAVAPRETTHEAANELFAEAQRARAEGRGLDAARAFDQVRRTYRKDPHAALAAFELGRLRLDVLGDPVGAEEALHDAIVLGPDSPLREDAEARRVEALSQAADWAGCVAAREAYLAHWPNGTYRRTVELYCRK